MIALPKNSWGQYTTKLDGNAFDLYVSTANANQTVYLRQNGRTIRGTVSENKDSNNNVVNYEYRFPVTGVNDPVTEYQLRVLQGNEDSIDYPVIIYKPQTATDLESVSINPGRENEAEVKQSGNETYEVELDMAETSARLVIKTADSRATISMNDPAGSARVLSGTGMLDARVPLSGTAKTVTFTVKATDGKSETVYYLDLTQTYSTTALGVVTVNGQALTASGRAYTMVGQMGVNADLTITAGDNVSIQVMDHAGAVQTAMDGSNSGVNGWSGKLTVRGDVDNYFTIRVTSQKGDQYTDYDLVLRNEDLATGLSSVEVRMNASDSALDGIAYHPVNPDAGSTTVYTVPVGSDERYLDFRFATISSEVEREQNWPAKYAQYHADGDFYRMDLEKLSDVKDHDAADESFYKEFYVPLFVETQYVDGKA